MPQTKNQFLEKFEEILDLTRANIRINGERLFGSGAVDPENSGDDYILPKAILCASLLDEAAKWEPSIIQKQFRRLVNNLRLF